MKRWKARDLSLPVSELAMLHCREAAQRNLVTAGPSQGLGVDPSSQEDATLQEVLPNVHHITPATVSLLGKASLSDCELLIILTSCSPQARQEF